MYYKPFLNAFKGNIIQVMFIPASCTVKLQLWDVADSDPFIDTQLNKFNEWYSDKISEALGSGNNIAETQIYLKISTNLLGCCMLLTTPHHKNTNHTESNKKFDTRVRVHVTLNV